MQVTAAVLEEHHKPLNVQELEIDEPLAGEVLVKIVASGVCHTDAIAQEANFPFPLPGVLGHEGAGIVEAVGDGVTKVAQGDKVIIGWPWCGECRNCLAGRQRYCLQIGPLVGAGVRLSTGGSCLSRGGEAVHGHFFGQSSFSTYSMTTERAVVKVADDAPIELLGPLGCGLATGAGAIFNALRPGGGLVHRDLRHRAPSASRRPWRPRSAAPRDHRDRRRTTIASRSPRSSARRTRSTRRRPTRSRPSARSRARARSAPTTRWSAPATSTSSARRSTA